MSNDLQGLRESLANSNTQREQRVNNPQLFVKGEEAKPAVKPKSKAATRVHAPNPKEAEQQPKEDEGEGNGLPPNVTATLRTIKKLYGAWKFTQALELALGLPEEFQGVIPEQIWHELQMGENLDSDLEQSATQAESKKEIKKSFEKRYPIGFINARGMIKVAEGQGAANWKYVGKKGVKADHGVDPKHFSHPDVKESHRAHEEKHNGGSSKAEVELQKFKDIMLTEGLTSKLKAEYEGMSEEAKNLIPESFKYKLENHHSNEDVAKEQKDKEVKEKQEADDKEAKEKQAADDKQAAKEKAEREADKPKVETQKDMEARLGSDLSKWSDEDMDKWSQAESGLTASDSVKEGLKTVLDIDIDKPETIVDSDMSDIMAEIDSKVDRDTITREEGDALMTEYMTKAGEYVLSQGTGESQLEKAESGILKVTGNKHEGAIAISGNVPYFVTNKHESMVDMSPLLNLTDKKKVDVFTHNHPSSSGFSGADFITAWGNGYKEMRAVAPESVFGAGSFVLSMDSDKRVVNKKVTMRVLEQDVQPQMWNSDTLTRSKFEEYFDDYGDGVIKHLEALHTIHKMLGTDHVQSLNSKIHFEVNDGTKIELTRDSIEKIIESAGVKKALSASKKSTNKKVSKENYSSAVDG